MEQLSTKLLEWGAVPERAPVVEKLRRRTAEICSGMPAGRRGPRQLRKLPQACCARCSRRVSMNGPVYDFRSDNVGGAAPEIIEAIVAANTGTAAPYGDDDHTRRMNERFATLFERPVQVFAL